MSTAVGLGFIALYAVIVIAVFALIRHDPDQAAMRRHRKSGHAVDYAGSMGSVGFPTGFAKYRCSCGEEWLR